MFFHHTRLPCGPRPSCHQQGPRDAHAELFDAKYTETGVEPAIPIVDPFDVEYVPGLAHVDGKDSRDRRAVSLLRAGLQEGCEHFSNGPSHFLRVEPP